MQKLDFLVPGRFVKGLASKKTFLYLSGLKSFFKKNTCLVLLNNIS